MSSVRFLVFRESRSYKKYGNCGKGPTVDGPRRDLPVSARNMDSLWKHEWLPSIYYLSYFRYAYNIPLKYKCAIWFRDCTFLLFKHLSPNWHHLPLFTVIVNVNIICCDIVYSTKNRGLRGWLQPCTHNQWLFLFLCLEVINFYLKTTECSRLYLNVHVSESWTVSYSVCSNGEWFMVTQTIIEGLHHNTHLS